MREIRPLTESANFHELTGAINRAVMAVGRKEYGGEASKGPYVKWEPVELLVNVNLDGTEKFVDGYTEGQLDLYFHPHCVDAIQHINGERRQFRIPLDPTEVVRAIEYARKGESYQDKAKRDYALTDTERMVLRARICQALEIMTWPPSIILEKGGTLDWLTDPIDITVCRYNIGDMISLNMLIYPDEVIFHQQYVSGSVKVSAPRDPDILLKFIDAHYKGIRLGDFKAE